MANLVETRTPRSFSRWPEGKAAPGALKLTFTPASDGDPAFFITDDKGRILGNGWVEARKLAQLRPRGRERQLRKLQKAGEQKLEELTAARRPFKLPEGREVIIDHEEYERGTADTPAV